MRNRIRKISIPIVALLLFLTVHAQKQEFIKVKGKEIIGLDGKPFLLKGTNLGNWLVPEGYMFKFKNTNSPAMITQAIGQLLGPEDAALFWKTYLDNYITEEDIHFLKSMGANSVRLPFSYRLFTSENYLSANDPKRGFAFMDRIVKWCKKEKLYLVLDMHCAPGGQTGDNIDDGEGYPYLFTSSACQEKTMQIWKSIAKRYSQENIIIGYDLLNEPVAHYFNTAELNACIEPFYKRLVAEIRKVDKNHIIFLGGAQWNTNFKIFNAPFDNNVVYTFHKYGDKPNQGSIQRFIDFRNKYNVPIYAGETGENTDEWIRIFRRLLDSNNIGWHFWPYKKFDSQKNMVSVPVDRQYDSLIKFVESPRDTYKNIRAAMPVNKDIIKTELTHLLENIKFNACQVNSGYIEALGFSIEEKHRTD